MKNHSYPDYKTIYKDILEKKFPDKKKEYEHLQNKENFSVIDVIVLDKKYLILPSKMKSLTKDIDRSFTKATIFSSVSFLKFLQAKMLFLKPNV